MAADHFLSEVQELIDAAEPPVEWLLIDAEGIVDIDVTATEAISSLQCELKRKGIVLAIARANHPLQKMLKRAGLAKRIGANTSIRRYVPACRRSLSNWRRSRHPRLDNANRTFLYIHAIRIKA
jgi:MFS superfamily sulfate permease-like transporter